MMKMSKHKKRNRGASLVEAVVAVAVLAVAMPLALAAMGKAGESSGAARAETRAPVIASFIRSELEAARQDGSEIYGTLTAGQAFPTGGLKALAFGRDGAFLGQLTQAQYDKGIDRIEGNDVFFVASAKGVSQARGVLVTVRIEHPAVRKPSKRSVVELYTLLP